MKNFNYFLRWTIFVKLSFVLCGVILFSLPSYAQLDPANAVPKYEIPTLANPSADAFVITYNVMDYGADNTGTRDNADIVQALLDKMGPASNGSGQNNGGVLFFPAGKYLINKSIRLPKGITIRGEWKIPEKGKAITGTIIMTTLGKGKDTETNVNYESESLIRMEPSSSVKDLAFWYPEQSAGNVEAYPPTILYGRDGHWGNDYCTVQNVTFINSYDGVIFTQKGIGGAPNAYNLYGTPLRKGVEIDNIAEVGRIEGADFSPEYWAGSGLAGAPANDASFKEWLRNNATGVVMRRNDWAYTSRLKVEGYKIGFHAVLTRYQPGLTDKPNGQNYDMVFTDCMYGIYASDPQYTGVMFHKIVIENCDYGIYFPSTAENTFQISSASINAKKYAIRADKGSASRMLFDQCTVTSGVVEVLGGTLVLTDSDVNNNAPQIKIGADARAIITGNRSNTPFNIQNNSLYRCEIDHTPLNNPQYPTFPYQDPWTIKQKPDRVKLYLATSAEFGAQPNVNTDNTSAIQNALNKASQDGGGIVYLPPGKYRVNGSLTIPTGVELKGAMDISSLPTGPGSVLESYGNKNNESGTPFIVMSERSGVRGLSINYPEQLFEELVERDNGKGGLTPYTYPHSIRANKDCYIVNMSFRAAYKGIDMFTNKCDNAYLEYVGGHFFINGIHVGGKTENALIRNTQCNTIAYAFGQESKWGSWPNSSPNGVSNEPSYQQNSRDLEFFTLGDCKNLLLYNNFYFGCQRGCVFANEGDGPSGIALGHGIDSAVKALYFEKIGEGGFDMIGSQMVALPCGISSGGQQATRYIETTADFTGEATLYSGDFWGLAYYAVEIGNGTINLHNTCFSAAGTSRFAEINTAQSSQLNISGSYVQNSNSPINSQAEPRFSIRSSILTEGSLDKSICSLYENNLLNSWEFDFNNTVDRSGWIATASHGNSNANNALDGNLNTRWDTQAVLTGGEWFMVNMIEPQTFNKILLDQGSSSGDYPISYEIYISDNGINWGAEPVVTGSGTSAVTNIDLPAVVTAQYVKIVQTGQVGRYWSVYEFYIVNTEPQVDKSDWIATASNANYKANLAIDGDLDTRWDTEVVLTGGEWFMVDMIVPQTFNRILLDQGSSSGDYPIGYEVYVSNDGVNWGAALVTGNGTNATTVIDLPYTVTNQYVKIVQVGQTGRYWSIHEFDIENVEPEIGKSDWIATASNANYKANLAIDGDASSRWDTEAVLIGGEWFMVDMIVPQTFNRILLDQGSSSGDYPIGYEVYVSNDGINWGVAVISGSGTGTVTTIDLPYTVTNRFVKIVQVGQIGRYWSIHEFDILNVAAESLVADRSYTNLNVIYADSQLYMPELIGAAQIDIYSISGQLLKSGISNSTSFSVQLETGVYILSIKNEGNLYRKKIMIKKK